MSFPERIRYGATELRRFYNQNLFIALGISVALHLGLIGLYLTGADPVIAGSDITGRDSTMVVFEKFKDLNAKKEPTRSKGESSTKKVTGESTPMLPPDVPVMTGSAAPAGNPKAVEDELLAKDKGKFATTDQIASGTPDGKGDGGSPEGTSREGGSGSLQNGGGEAPKAEPVVDDIPNEFPEPNMVMPDVDLAELSARAVYPRLARENGIEGKVTVKVLIAEDGRALRTSIEGSSNEILDSAAIRAVRTTIFKPATLNGEPVRAWLFLPISFTLE